MIINPEFTRYLQIQNNQIECPCCNLDFLARTHAGLKCNELCSFYIFNILHDPELEIDYAAFQIAKLNIQIDAVNKKIYFRNLEREFGSMPFGDFNFFNPTALLRKINLYRTFQ